MVIDIAIMLFFVFAIVGMIMGYKQKNDPRRVFSANASSIEVITDGTQISSRHGGSGMSKFANPGSAQTGGTDDQSSAPTPDDEFTLSDDANSTSSTNANEPPLVAVSLEEKLKFKDVTVTAYKNMRLGFVMELPANWRLLYEHFDEVLFVSDSVTTGTTVEDVRRTPRAMWLSVGTVCQSADATSTSFALLNASTTPTRERYACVPPLKINMGVRADQPNMFEQQAFLLDIERTIYPTVR